MSKVKVQDEAGQKAAAPQTSHERQEAPRKDDGPARTSANSPSGATGRADAAKKLQGQLGNRRALQLLARHGPSADSSRALQRKCDCQETGGGSCPTCAGGAKQRALAASAPAIRPGSEKPEAIKETPGVKEAGKCPPQTVKVHKPVVGVDTGEGQNDYGAAVTLCYKGAKGWWFAEEVKPDKDTCYPGADIKQSKDPGQGQNASHCVTDLVLNPNGPAVKVAPCKSVTEQIVYAGPSQAEYRQCKYENKQVIEVTLDKKSSPRSGKVKVSSGGERASSDWTE